MIFTYGELQVPWTVMWSDEDEYFVGECPWFKLPAICQNQKQGKGVPKFGQPNIMRQRKVMALGLCDLCAKPLRDRTKISLSNLFKLPLSEHYLQAEPMLHKECAIASIKNCPSLKRQLEAGRLHIMQILKYKPLPTPAYPADLAKYVPDHKGSELVGLAVLEILSKRDHSLNWLLN